MGIAGLSWAGHYIGQDGKIEGSTRGPRGPKNSIYNLMVNTQQQHYHQQRQHQDVHNMVGRVSQQAGDANRGQRPRGLHHMLCSQVRTQPGLFLGGNFEKMILKRGNYVKKLALFS